MPDPTKPEASTPPDQQEDALLQRLFSSADDETEVKKEDASVDPSRVPGAPKGRDLFEVLEDIKSDPEGGKPPAKKEEKKDDAPPAAAAPAEPAPVERPIRRRQRTPDPVPPVVVAPPAPVVPAAPAPDANAWEKDLLEEERDQLETARFAEKKFPEKYKGLGDKVAKFLKDHAAKVSAEGFDASDPRYTDWVNKNRPAMSQHEIRTIERARAKDETLSEVEERHKDLSDETFRTVTAPTVKAKADQFFKTALIESLPAEAQSALNDPAKGVRFLKQNFALELEVAENITKAAADDVEVLNSLTTTNPRTGRAMTAYDKSNPAHVRVIEMIRDVNTQFAQAVQNRPERIRNGKYFATKLDYMRMPPEQQAKYWTLSDAEVVSLYKSRVKGIVGNAIKGERERLSRYFPKPAAAAPAARDESPPPAHRPSAGPTGKPDASDSSDRFLAESLYGKPID